MPEAKQELMSVADRDPWQVTELAQFDRSSDVSLREFSKIKDERGLAAYSLRLGARAKTRAPDPSQSEGQYVVVMRGSLNHQGRIHNAITIAFVKPDEQALAMEAGPDGLEALVLNFPRQHGTVSCTATGPAGVTKSRVWQCRLCAYAYDEAEGLPDDGIAAGTRWEDVPEGWSCPDCCASKADFEMQLKKQTSQSML